VTGARVAVVGGGLAGIAAALDLAEAGATVTLYESRSRLGGATYSVRRGDHWIDNGQHVLLRCCTAYRAFLARLGVEHLVPIQPRLRIPVLREGKPPAFLRRAPLPAPLHLVPTLLRYALLGRRERLNTLRAAAAPSVCWRSPVAVPTAPTGRACSPAGPRAAAGRNSRS